MKSQRNGVAVIAGGVALSLVLGAGAGAQVIGFDDLEGDNLPVPPGYGGVAEWPSWTYYGFSQPPYNPTSPPVRVYNTGSGRIVLGDEKVLVGAWFNGHGTSRGFQPIHFELYLDGNAVHTSEEIDLDSSGNAMFLESGYNQPIDEIVVVGSYGFFIMDDIEFGEAGLGLNITGSCPGEMSVCVTGNTEGDRVAVIYSFQQGSGPEVPGCPGVNVDLVGPTIVGVGNADANGEFCVSGNVPAAGCGRVFVQGVNVSQCLTSSVGDI